MPIDPAQLPEMAPEMSSEQLATRMGLELITLSLEEVVGRIPVAGNRQPYGLLHGGAGAVPAETLVCTAKLTCLHRDSRPQVG